ncbi:MAG: ATP-binding protein [Phycisphaerales bacterium]
MRTSPARLSRRWILSALIPAATCALTLVAWQLSRHQADATALARLNARADSFSRSLGERLEHYHDLLGHIGGLFAASQSVEPDEWSAFLKTADIQARYPAIHELFYLEQRPTPLGGPEPPALAVHSLRGGWKALRPGGPADGPTAALLQRAEDAGGLVMQSVPTLPGEPWTVLLCRALPQDEGDGGTQGWVVAVAGVAEVVQRFADQYQPHIGVHIESRGSPQAVHLESAAAGPLLTASTDMTFGGETWRLSLRSSAEALTEGSSAGLILAAGFGASGFIVLVLWSLSRAHGHALAHRRSEHRLQSALDSVHDYAILVLDRAGRIAQCNAGVAAVLGYTPRELEGAHFSRFYTPEALADRTPEHELETASAAGRSEDEGWRVRKDGRHIWANSVLSPLRDRDGQLHGFMKITRDMTERRRAQEELAQHARELARSNAELQQFAYVASHDLQEPLRAISSYLQLLQRRYKGSLDAKADEFIAFAVDGAARMKQLINDLLGYSRAGTRPISIVPTSAELILAQALQELRIAVAESGARVTHGPLPTVPADPGQLRQVFLNLIGNAIKFRGHAAPEVHISARQRPEGWEFSVRDNGIGIEPQYAERIFEIFQRLHTRERYAGTGIGLSICKRILDRHGGRIWVEAAPGAGSTFRFLIPAHVAPTQGVAHAA